MPSPSRGNVVVVSIWRRYCCCLCPAPGIRRASLIRYIIGDMSWNFVLEGRLYLFSRFVFDKLPVPRPDQALE